MVASQRLAEQCCLLLPRMRWTWRLTDWDCVFVFLDSACWGKDALQIQMVSLLVRISPVGISERSLSCSFAEPVLHLVPTIISCATDEEV